MTNKVDNACVERREHAVGENGERRTCGSAGESLRSKSDRGQSKNERAARARLHYVLCSFYFFKKYFERVQPAWRRKVHMLRGGCVFLFRPTDDTARCLSERRGDERMANKRNGEECEWKE